MRTVFILLSMVCAVAIVNAAPKTKGSGKSAPTTPKQLTDYMVAHGDESTVKVEGRKASNLLGLPSGVAEVPVKGDSTEENELEPNTMSTCEIVVEKVDNKTKPICMLIVWEQTHRAAHKVETYMFRFNTDGKLERAVYGDGVLDDAGEGVPGTATATALDVKAPDVKKRAAEQLALWLNRTARQLAEKKKTAASK